MLFHETSLKGVFIIDLTPFRDERGFFARSFCQSEFEKHGLIPKIAQCNISFNLKRGTLRGMHYQMAPHEEAKLVRCIRGSIYDVVLDLRRDSVTFGMWVAAELTAENRRMVYIPEACAHGFQTLEDNSEVLYQMSEPYHPECANGVRWDDQAFGIKWPIKEITISINDNSYSLLDSRKLVK